MKCNKPGKNEDSGVPFIAKLAIAPEATLRIVVLFDDRNSNKRASKPPSSTIFSWLISEIGRKIK